VIHDLYPPERHEVDLVEGRRSGRDHLRATLITPSRLRANMVHIRQSKPDPGLDFQLKVSSPGNVSKHKASPLPNATVKTLGVLPRRARRHTLHSRTPRGCGSRRRRRCWCRGGWWHWRGARTRVRPVVWGLGLGFKVSRTPIPLNPECVGFGVWGVGAERERERALWFGVWGLGFRV